MLRQRGRADTVSAAAPRPRRRRSARKAALRKRVEIAVVLAAGQASGWFTATVEALNSQASNLDLVFFLAAPPADAPRLMRLVDPYWKVRVY